MAIWLYIDTKELCSTNVITELSISTWVNLTHIIIRKKKEERQKEKASCRGVHNV